MPMYRNEPEIKPWLQQVPGRTDVERPVVSPVWVEPDDASRRVEAGDSRLRHAAWCTLTTVAALLAAA